jgi:acetamidase/formamidase
MRARFLFAASLLQALLAASQTPAANLAASPSTVVWGYYSAHAKPVMTVHSGDTVRIQTLSTCGSTERMIEEGVAPADIPAYNSDIYREVKDRGPGGHILTGPLAIAEAEPGDVLEVQILKIEIDVPFACNGFGTGRGFLPNDFPYSRRKIIPLDRERMIAKFAPGIEIPLHPFFGSMGVAPPESAHLLWPRAETPTSYICMGFSPDLKEATTLAVRDMINFLVEEKHLSRDDAYMLTSVAVDVDITQLVDGNVGVHAMCPKAMFK